jgi:hypothetical protein
VAGRRRAGRVDRTSPEWWAVRRRPRRVLRELRAAVRVLLTGAALEVGRSTLFAVRLALYAILGIGLGLAALAVAIELLDP